LGVNPVPSGIIPHLRQPERLCQLLLELVPALRELLSAQRGTAVQAPHRVGEAQGIIRRGFLSAQGLLAVVHPGHRPLVQPELLRVRRLGEVQSTLCNPQVAESQLLRELAGLVVLPCAQRGLHVRGTRPGLVLDQLGVHVRQRRILLAEQVALVAASNA
jgi:hypothetical protein